MRMFLKVGPVTNADILYLRDSTIFSFKEKSKSITHTSKDFYQLSDAQINLFGNQLSRLHELSHLASEGESYEILAAKIKDMLRNPHQQQQFLPHLKNLGFKA